MKEFERLVIKRVAEKENGNNDGNVIGGGAAEIVLTNCLDMVRNPDTQLGTGCKMLDRFLR